MASCVSFLSTFVPLLKKYYFDFDQNVKNFKSKKREVECKKDTYNAELAVASRDKMIPNEDVVNWIRDYEVEIKERDLLENDLKTNSGSKWFPYTRCKLSMKLLEMIDKMTELIDRYNKVRGSMFIEDLVSKNDDILMNFEDTKKEFEATIETYEGHRLSAVKKQKIPTELVRLWIADCAKLKTKYGGGNTEIQVEGESSHRREERIGQMKEMENLINRYKQFGGFSEMFVDQPLQIVEKRSTDFISLSSMKSNKNRVYKALSEGERVIKFFGMGGVGKTTLMKQINNEMSGGTNFKLVIWVTVSTTYADIKDIQSQICHRLKLQWSDIEDNSFRANKISDYLKNNVDGSTLFIFDDVWKKLDLKKIGIPYGTYGNDGRKCCKIILTTRDRNVKVIYEMPPKDIEMKGLDEAESWILFKINASIEDNVDDRIKELAKEICRKCAGLPLVITVIAKMLNIEKEEVIWSETLTFLNKDDPSLDIPDLSEEVYIPLKLSYDRLGREDLKIGFLLCSLFPEDYEIAPSDLFYYGMGADRIAESCQSFDACHNIFIHLKNKGLLQDGKKYDSARMHDVIRDVAHFIGKAESDFKDLFCKPIKFQTFFGKKEIKSEHLDQFVETENMLLLDLRRTSIEPESAMLYIKKLKELRVLLFEHFLSKISVNIKEYFILHELSVLCLNGAHIKELNKEFSIELCNLRVIYFSAAKIDVIRPKAFSNLHDKLEVLCMANSFNLWQASDEEDGEYASFAELAELKKLHSLQVDIRDCNIFSHEYRPDLVFSSVEFFAINTNRYHERWNFKELELPSQRLVKNGANWIKDLLKKTESLAISCSYTEVDIALTYDIIVNTICRLKKFRLLEVQKCKYAIEYSSNTEGNHSTSKPILPKAKELGFRQLKDMENIFVSTLTPTVIPKGSFGKLQSIDICACPMLKFIFPWNLATCLVQLQSLGIKSCVQLEVIVEKEDNRGYSQGEHVLFPELIDMELSDLPKLECVSTLTPTVIPKGSFQKLQSIVISKCPMLKFIPWNVATCLVQLHSLAIIECDQLEVIVDKEGRDCDQGERGFFPELTNMELLYLPKLEYVSTLTPTVIPKGSFQKLQRIQIRGCLRLKLIFPWNVATCLVQLHYLKIIECDQLEVIVEKEDNRDCNQGTQVLFPKLREMVLFLLPKMEYVPSGSDENLENLKRRWLLGENSAPNLKLIQWDERIFWKCVFQL